MENRIFYENSFFISDDQKEVICKHFGKNPKDVAWWEVMEMLDEIIDNLVEVN